MPVTTPPAIVQRIDSTLAAANADSGARLQANFAPNATLVDEIPPFYWSGPNAGERWWHSVDRYAAMNGAAGPLRVRRGAIADCVLTRDGDHAYIIVPLRVTVRVKGKVSTEQGQWVLTLHRTAGAWAITTATWDTTT